MFPPHILWLLRCGWVGWGAKICFRLPPFPLEGALAQPVVLKPFTGTSWCGAHGTGVVEIFLYRLRPSVDGPSM